MDDMAVTAGTPRALALAAALRRARERAGVGLRELSRRMGKPYATLAHWERGTRVPRPEDVAVLLTVLEAPADEREELADLARHAAERNWLAVGTPGITQQLAAVMECERMAESIVEWSPMVVPGLLQTADYARAIFQASGAPGSLIETQVTLRMGRRDVLLRQDPVRFTALIGEPTLYAQIGGPEVLAAQLRFLLEMAERESVSIRVVPNRAGWHPGHAGPFIVYRLGQSIPPLVHLEHHRSGIFLSGSREVETYQEAASSVTEVALSPEESVQRITTAIKEMEEA